MITIHNKLNATKMRKIIAATEPAKRQCALAVGKKGTKGGRAAVATVGTADTARGRLNTVKFETKNRPPLIPPGDEKPGMLCYGLAQLSGTTLEVACVKYMGGPALNKALKSYFWTNFKVKPVWNRVVTRKATGAEIEKYVPLEDEEAFAQLVTEDALAAKEAAVGDVTEDDPEDGADDEEWTLVGKDGAEEGSEPDMLQAGGAEGAAPIPRLSDPEEPEKADALSAELQAAIRSQTAAVVANVLKVAAAIGLELGATEQALVDKISGWLERILAATPPAERAAKLYDVLASLALALSRVESMRELAGGESDAAETSEDGKKTDTDTTLLNRKVDLEQVANHKTSPQELIDLLFAEGKAIVAARQTPDTPIERQLAYDLDRANADLIKKTVEKSWPAESGEKQLEMIGKLRDLIRGAFTKDDRLIDYLGLKHAKIDLAKREQGATNDLSVIQPAIDRWLAARASAQTIIDDIKAAVAKVLKDYTPGDAEAEGQASNLTVEKLGGTWSFVDNILLQLDENELPDALKAVVGKDGDSRAKALDGVESVLQTSKDYLSGNNIVDLLDQANKHFDGLGGGAVGEALKQGLDAANSALADLKQLQSSAAVAA